MVKNKSKLAIKLFIIVWVVLAIHIALKLTFNYWQPYVISNDKLQAISDFIDANRWIRNVLDCILYVFNSIVVILCSIKRWWFKTKKQAIIIILISILCFTYSLITKDTIINTILLTALIPLILDKKKWFYLLLTFVLNNLFILLSLWLEGFVNADNMPYMIQTFLVFDYYIMLVLNYFVFNLIRKKE